MQNIEKSIELNDNRAVYRSRELLDQDRAARGASLARIYNDLGFQQLGINEATKSLSLDPANAGAHRFLSDVYLTQPRREIARVSELLQAQLLQDININPVQPSLSETNINISTRGGPATPGFNEFTPMFERNRAQLNVSGLVGNENTIANETVVSGIYDQYSVSAGQFHSETDGFRPNNDVNYDVYDLFAQAALTPKMNLQAEVRRLTSQNGDLEFNFDPTDFDPLFHEDVNQTTARLGARFSPSPQSSFIASLIYNDRSINFPQARGDTRSQAEGAQTEAEYLFRAANISLISGLSLFDTSRITRSRRDSSRPPSSNKYDINQETAFVYANFTYPTALTWTLGVSYDKYDQQSSPQNDLHISSGYPKLGLQWDINSDLRLRLAAFRTVKPSLVTNRTIQPTQVAGFNQFFDDANGTEAWFYGAALDVHLAERLDAGVEASMRDRSEPVPSFGRRRADRENRNDYLYRGYIYWAPFDEWAASAELSFDAFDSTSVGSNLPTQVETSSIPISVLYFSPLGLFGRLTAALVHQHVSRPEGSKGTSTFSVIDAGAGYRLPNGRGVVSIEVDNLLNTNMDFQDDTYREFVEQERQSNLIPDRSILGRIMLTF